MAVLTGKTMQESEIDNESKCEAKDKDMENEEISNDECKMARAPAAPPTAKQTTKKIKKKDKRRGRKYKPGPITKCSFCSKEKPRAGLTKEEKKPYCSTCYNKHVRPKHKCGVCGEMAKKNGKNAAGVAVCHKCYRKEGDIPKKKCSVCKEDKIIALYTASKEPICTSLLQASSPQMQRLR